MACVVCRSQMLYGKESWCQLDDSMKRQLRQTDLKVVRSALSNAASISGLMLTTECLVTNLEDEDKEKQRVEGSVR